MKIRNSLKSLKGRHRDNRVVGGVPRIDGLVGQGARGVRRVTRATYRYERGEPPRVSGTDAPDAVSAHRDSSEIHPRRIQAQPRVGEKIVEERNHVLNLLLPTPATVRLRRDHHVLLYVFRSGRC